MNFLYNYFVHAMDKPNRNQGASYQNSKQNQHHEDKSCKVI